MEQWEGQRSAEEAAPNSVEAPVEEPEGTSEIVDQDPAGDGADDAPRRQYSGVGARVTAVLTAAEKAAEQMLTLAREEADELRRQAHSEAEALVERRRFEAEEEARQRLAQADVEADGIRARAEAEGREVEAKARMRQERFLEETRLLADRVEWARGGLGEITARLTEVLYEPDFEPAEGQRLGAGGGQSLASSGLESVPEAAPETGSEPTAADEPASTGWDRPEG
ncbi:MAG: ATP synthase F0 subunit B [Actinobacteria bacterium]|nr:MAG: ATP synthase F0 subunit B [Actinomycetota bacterium]